MKEETGRVSERPEKVGFISSSSPPLMDLLSPDSEQTAGLFLKFSSKKCFYKLHLFKIKLLWLHLHCIFTIQQCCCDAESCIAAPVTLLCLFVLLTFLASPPSFSPFSTICFSEGDFLSVILILDSVWAANLKLFTPSPIGV